MDGLINAKLTTNNGLGNSDIETSFCSFQLTCSEIRKWGFWVASCIFKSSETFSVHVSESSVMNIQLLNDR